MFNDKLPPIHPGEILSEEFLQPMGITPAMLARELHIPRTRITRIVNKESSVTADTALRLSRFFGNSAQFWLNLQTSYDLKNTTAKISDIETIRPYHAAA